MMKYRLIASDLDGTLINSKSEISKENIDAINRLCEKGVHFVPCTGRTFSELPSEIKNIESIRYFICSNGAVVFDREGGKCITNCISNDIGREIMEIVKPYETHILFRHNGECFVDSKFQNEKSFEYYNVIDCHQDVILDHAVYLDNFEKTISNTDDFEVFSIFFHNYEDKLRCRELMKQTKKLKVVEFCKYNLEIMDIKAGKGNALRSLADMLNVSYDETIGVGDSDNDSSLINSAGLGLAVSNACDPLKKIADEIICSNDEHIAHYVLDKYISKEITE